MNARLLAAVCVATGLATSVLPAQADGSSPARCQHLIVGQSSAPDHLGNDAPYPSQVDNPDPVTLRWAELRTTRTQLIATIAVKRLDEGDSTLDHGYSFTFRNGSTAIQLEAMFGRISSWARASKSETGTQPQDDGVYAGSTLGLIQASRDLHLNRVTLTADLSLLGVGREPLTRLGAQTWSGLMYGKGGTYGIADRATTTKSYRPGTPDCLAS
jgi:hypothetical protein